MDKTDNEKEDAPGTAHSRQGVGSECASDNDQINRIVSLLEKIPQKEGNRKKNNEFDRIASCQVFLQGISKGFPASCAGTLI